ncbi:MAG: hypothetical protein ACRD38_00300 [Nitrososphaerales archaeon]
MKKARTKSDQKKVYYPLPEIASRDLKFLMAFEESRILSTDGIAEKITAKSKSERKYEFSHKRILNSMKKLQRLGLVKPYVQVFADNMKVLYNDKLKGLNIECECGSSKFLVEKSKFEEAIEEALAWKTKGIAIIPDGFVRLGNISAVCYYCDKEFNSRVLPLTNYLPAKYTSDLLLRYPVQKRKTGIAQTNYWRPTYSGNLLILSQLDYDEAYQFIKMCETNDLFRDALVLYNLGHKSLLRDFVGRLRDAKRLILTSVAQEWRSEISPLIAKSNR